MAGFCSQCGAPLVDGAKFCSACGAKAEEAAVSRQPIAVNNRNRNTSNPNKPLTGSPRPSKGNIHHSRKYISRNSPRRKTRHGRKNPRLSRRKKAWAGLSL